MTDFKRDHFAKKDSFFPPLDPTTEPLGILDPKWFCREIQRDPRYFPRVQQHVLSRAGLLLDVAICTPLRFQRSSHKEGWMKRQLSALCLRE